MRQGGTSKQTHLGSESEGEANGDQTQQPDAGEFLAPKLSHPPCLLLEPALALRVFSILAAYSWLHLSLLNGVCQRLSLSLLFSLPPLVSSCSLLSHLLVFVCLSSPAVHLSLLRSLS